MAGIKIKDLLHGEMKRSGLSARGLAVRMGLPPQSINNWIDSNTHPSAKSLNAIAAYFKVKPGDLIDDPGEPAAIVKRPESDPDTRLADMQRMLNVLTEDLLKIHSTLDAQASEIGAIKDRLIDASTTGDIKRLDIVTLKGPSSVN